MIARLVFVAAMLAAFVLGWCGAPLGAACCTVAAGIALGLEVA